MRFVDIGQSVSYNPIGKGIKLILKISEENAPATIGSLALCFLIRLLDLFRILTGRIVGAAEE